MSNGAELVNLPPISARNDTAPSTTADAVGEGAEPAVEPVVEPIVEIVVEPPVIEPVAEPAVEPVNEPVIDRPSKPFKLTRHRMYIILLTLGFGLSKAVFAYMGHSVIPTTLEFILGGVVAAGMYSIGLYEEVRPKRFKCYLHDPLTRRDAITEALLSFTFAAYVYCYLRFAQEAWDICDTKTIIQLVFLLVTIPVSFIYICRWRRIVGLPTFPWDTFIYYGFSFLNIAPFWKFGERFTYGYCTAPIYDWAVFLIGFGSSIFLVLLIHLLCRRFLFFV